MRVVASIQEEQRARSLDTGSEEVVPLAAAALRCGYTASGFLAMVRRTGGIPIVRLGGRRIMFRKSDLDRLITESVGSEGRAPSPIKAAG